MDDPATDSYYLLRSLLDKQSSSLASLDPAAWDKRLQALLEPLADRGEDTLNSLRKRLTHVYNRGSKVPLSRAMPGGDYYRTLIEPFASSGCRLPESRYREYKGLVMRLLDCLTTETQRLIYSDYFDWIMQSKTVTVHDPVHEASIDGRTRLSIVERFIEECLILDLTSISRLSLDELSLRYRAWSASYPAQPVLGSEVFDRWLEEALIRRSNRQCRSSNGNGSYFHGLTFR